MRSFLVPLEAAEMRICTYITYRMRRSASEDPRLPWRSAVAIAESLKHGTNGLAWWLWSQDETGVGRQRIPMAMTLATSPGCSISKHRQTSALLRRFALRTSFWSGTCGLSAIIRPENTICKATFANGGIKNSPRINSMT